MILNFIITLHRELPEAEFLWGWGGPSLGETSSTRKMRTWPDVGPTKSNRPQQMVQTLAAEKTVSPTRSASCPSPSDRMAGDAPRVWCRPPPCALHVCGRIMIMCCVRKLTLTSLRRRAAYQRVGYNIISGMHAMRVMFQVGLSENTQERQGLQFLFCKSTRSRTHECIVAHGLCKSGKLCVYVSISIYNVHVCIYIYIHNTTHICCIYNII